MNYDKKRWIVLIAACLINLCAGSLFAWSVFAGSMAEQLGVDTGRLSIVFTVLNGVSPLTMITGGRINDRFGSKWVVLTGGVTYGLGTFLSGFCNSVAMLTITYGICAGLGLGMIYGCTINNSIKFFPDKRGLVGGIATAVFGLSSVLMSPVANALISAYGVLAAFRVIGVVFLVVICTSAFFTEKCPADYKPRGWTPEKQTVIQTRADKEWRAMLSDPVFYVMLCMLTCGAFCGLMIFSQASTIAQRLIGVSPATAAICVSVIALFNMTGRVAAGFISDKLGRVKTLAIMLIISITGFILLIMSGSGTHVIFMAGFSMIGISFGSFMGVFPGFTADQFGSKNNSVNYGIMFIGFAVAGIFGPVVLNSIYSQYASYKYAFFVCAALAVLGLALTYIYRQLSRKAG